MTSCCICDNPDLAPALACVYDREYLVTGAYRFIRCQRCRALSLDPQPTVDQLKTYYPPNYHGFHTSDNAIIAMLYRLVYRSRFATYRRLAGPTGRILDVGCADAQYFDLLLQKYPRMRPVGVEFIDSIAEAGRRKGRCVLTGTITDLPDSGDFDLIIMNNYIEHVLDPVSELRKASRLLKPNGHVIIETPNTDSWDLALCRCFWGGLHVPRHIHLFNRTTIATLAAAGGFHICTFKCLLNTDHWSLSVQNYLQSTTHFKTKLRYGRSFYFKYLLFLFIPINTIQMLLGKSGSLLTILRKTS